jgi:hypothetical protein
MRTKFLTLVALLVAGAAQADVVVIENAGGSGSSTAGNHFDIEWTQATTSAKFSTFKLFGYTGSAYNVQFDLFRNTGSGSTYIANELISGTNDFTFTGQISNASLTAGTYLLRITGLGDPPVNPEDPRPPDEIKAGYNFNSNPNGTTTGAYGFSNATQTAVSTGQFLTYQLSAVPEPGTMLLGGIAAACGGAGAWWKRRKRPLLLPENPAID